ncbi:BrnT family toxin [candidate division KSB1 bacterium]|nr:MAG: BrnT family toxin [candidate division KSB1 bacterium]
MQYLFEWNPVKAKQNIEKHGVSFERAGTILKDPYALSLFDKAHNQAEDRWITIGKDSTEIVLVVSHTYQNVNQSTVRIRIISARKATKREQTQYDARTP